MPTCSAGNVGSALRAEYPILPFLAPRATLPTLPHVAANLARVCGTLSSSRIKKRHAQSKLAEATPRWNSYVRRCPLTISRLSRTDTFQSYSQISSFVRRHCREYSSESIASVQPEICLVDNFDAGDEPGVIHASPAPPETEAGTSENSVQKHGSSSRLSSVKTASASTFVFPEPLSVFRSHKELQQWRKSHKPAVSNKERARALTDQRILWRHMYIESLQHGQAFPLSTLRIPTNGQLLAWIKGYAVLNATFDPWPTHLPHIPQIEFHSEAEGWVKCLFGSEPPSSLDSWRSLSETERETRRLPMLLWLLQHQPLQALEFLCISTKVDTGLELYIIQESLDYILRRLKSAEKSEELAGFMPFFLQLLETYPALIKTLEERWWRQLVHISTPEEAIQLYKIIEGSLTGFRGLRMLFALKCALSGHLDEAITTLFALFTAVERNSDLMHKYISTLLRACGKQKGGYLISTELASRLLQQGIQFNIHHYNTLMVNAVDAGDARTAFSIYRMIQENEISPDAYTFSIIINACKISENSTEFKTLVEQCAEMAIKLRNPVIATDYLHYHLLSRLRQGLDTFQPLLPIYRRFFNLAPLAHLGIIPWQIVANAQPSASSSRSGSGAMDPELPAMFMMLASRLQSNREETSDAQIVELYRTFRKLVEGGDPWIGRLAETTHTNNAFILAFCQRPNLLKHAASIIHAMDSPLSTGSVAEKLKRPIAQAKPDAQSWTILLKGFMTHKQPAAANKVLELMKQRGLEPTKITWEVILEGYAALQDVDGTVATLAAMEARGYELNESSLRALGRFRNRERLTERMAESDSAPWQTDHD